MADELYKKIFSSERVEIDVWRNRGSVGGLGITWFNCTCMFEITMRFIIFGITFNFFKKDKKKGG